MWSEGIDGPAAEDGAAQIIPEKSLYKRQSHKLAHGRILQIIENRCFQHWRHESAWWEGRNYRFFPDHAFRTQTCKPDSQAGSLLRREFRFVFGAMGILRAHFFNLWFQEDRRYWESGLFINLADDPSVERIATPEWRLHAPNTLLSEKDMHVLVILDDMTIIARRLARNIRSKKGNTRKAG